MYEGLLSRQKGMYEKGLEERNKFIDELTESLRKARSEHTEAPVAKLSTKERESLLKIIIAMALDGYRYEPAQAKSPIPQEITSALEERGITLNVDTVRK